MSQNWFYRQPGAPQEEGPVTFEELQALGTSGGLARTALVREGDGAWHLAQSMEELWTATPATEHLGELETALSFDDMGMKVVDETSPISTPTSLDDLDLGFNLVDESSSNAESLDDMGLHVVDESRSAAPPPRHGSRVLDDEEWTDPNAFRVDHVTPKKAPARDALDLDADLLNLAENALAGSGSNANSESSAAAGTRAGSPRRKREAGAPVGEYFIRVDGKPHGPIDFPTLRNWAEEGRLIEKDEIQLPGADLWIPASALPMLFEGIGAKSPAATTAQAAPASSSAASRPASPRPVAAPPVASPSPTPVARTPEPPAPPMPAPAAPAPPAYSSPASSYSPPAKKPNKPKIDRGPSAIGSMISGLFAGEGDSRVSPGVAIGVLAVVALFFGWSYFPSFKSNTKDYEAMIAVYAKSLELREKGSGEWSGFAKSAKEENTERLATLKETASAREPALQRMLWASEALGQVLGGQTKPDSPADVSFREHMATARSILGPDAPPVPGYEGKYHFGGSAD